jgi:hypothetical protein
MGEFPLKLQLCRNLIDAPPPRSQLKMFVIGLSLGVGSECVLEATRSADGCYGRSRTGVFGS